MRFNSAVAAVVESPITEAYSWLAERRGDAAVAEVIDVSQAVPGHPPPESLRRHVAELALDPAMHRYTHQLGIDELRAAEARDLGRSYGASVAPEQVAITAGCNQAFCLVADALAGPGDEVILPLPYYFNHDMWLRGRGVVPVYLPAGADLVPDPEEAARRITRRTRAIVLITPNNPTGAVYPPALLERFFDLAETAGLALIVDETYRDFRATAGPPHELFSRPRWEQTLVHLGSYSKVFCLAGYRVGSIAASESLLFEVAKLMDCVAICPPRLGQEAALFGLERLDGWREENRREMSGRVEVFRRRLDEESQARFEVAAAGAYFAYLRHPFSGEGSRTVARRLAREQGLLTLAGEMFGPGQERFLRVALANLAADRIPALVGRLAASTADAGARRSVAPGSR
ncbi:MAG TPA: aminotransferase [Thermoanaerobaculia bacterium]|nr:aminotransferase [Thermoanaerobaculia bacterium]